MSVLVSVIVPNYNYGRYLDARLQSLLAQTLQDIEVIVVDDASTDDSREVIERYASDPRVRTEWHDTRSQTTYERWNDGAALATGRYLHFAGADDVSEPEMLATLVEALERHPDAGFAYVRSRVIDADGTPLSVTPSHPRWDHDFVSDAATELPFLLDQKTIPTASALLMRRDLFTRCGGFDTSFVLAADHMLWARALSEAGIVYRAAPLNRFRTHDRTVRARVTRVDTVRERYRVFAYVFDAFAVSAEQRERVRDRLARNWAECWPSDRGAGRLARHRAIAAAARTADPHAMSRFARFLIEGATGVRLRGPRAVAGYAWRRLQDERHRLKGKRILWRYSSHYRRAQAVYRREHPEVERPRLAISGLGVHVAGDSAQSEIALPPDHMHLVDRLARAVAAELEVTDRCKFVPRLSAALPERTCDVTELRNRQLITIQLRDPLSLDALDELADPIMRELERRLYGSFVIVDKVYAYRSPISGQEPSASWVWHFDNHPREMLKVMVYLTDVSAETAPFEYLRSRATGAAVLGAPLAPLHHRSRVAPELVERYLASGCEIAQVTGPRGTVVVFDDNVIHRATLAKAGHRDVVVFQIRPSMFAARPYVDPRWTGSFLHQDIHRDPFDLAPRLKVAGAV